MFWKSIALVALLLGASLQQQLWPFAGTSPMSVTVFVCADDGRWSGRHELHYIRSAMNDIREVKLPDCESASFGYLVGRNGERIPALTVTTGIYTVSAAVCTVSLMASKQYAPSSMVFLGTAGISPTVGGWRPGTPGGCGVLQAPRKNALGSVCVTDGALLQECGVCVEDAISSECSRPHCVLHGNASYFGRCSFRHPSTLAAEIREAMDPAAFPPPPAVVQEVTEHFWRSHAAVDDRTPPVVPRMLRCAETDTSQILAGARSDVLCREYSHALIPEVPPEDHTCVQAMEGFGFLHVMSSFPNVPIALVRSGSNYDMYPMSQVGATTDGTPLWAQNESFVDSVEYTRFTRASYRYAVLTSSAVVLNYYTGKIPVSVD